MALDQDIRDPLHRGNNLRDQPVAANTVIYRGACVVLNGTGHAVPATEATGLRILGFATQQADNRGGAAGDKLVHTRRHGSFPMRSGVGPDAVTTAHITAPLYLIDDETVSPVATGRTRVGRLFDIDENGNLWVELD